MKELDLLILKVLVSNKVCALNIVQELTDEFFTPDYFRFSKIVIEYIKNQREIPTKRVLCERNEKLTKYIENIFDKLDKIEYDEKEYKHDLEKIKNRYAEKLIIGFKDSINNENFDSANSIKELQKINQKIRSLDGVKKFEIASLKEYLPRFKNEYIEKKNNPNVETGYLCKFKWIDDLIGGFKDGDLSIIGGDTNSGKSQVLLNIAINLWMQDNTCDTKEFTKGNNILYFSLEMPFKSCMNRVVASMSSTPSRDIRDAKVSGDDLARMKKSLDFIERYPYSFDIIDIARGATPETIESLFLERKESKDIKIVVIDYMGIMSSVNKNLDDWLALGEIAASLHEMARVNNIFVLTAVQLNRAKNSKDKNDIVGMSRIGRSQLILTHANHFLQIETRQNEKLYPTLLMHLLKNREGQLGNGQLLKNFACCKLSDYYEEEGVNFSDAGDISQKI